MFSIRLIMIAVIAAGGVAACGGKSGVGSVDYSGRR
jgi:hypothetical protein